MTQADRPPPPATTAWLLLAVVGIGAMGVFAWLAAQRVPYPFELEWMEGAMGDHADRVRHGLGLYVPPTPDHVAFLYTPLFFYLGALGNAALGPGLMPLRLVSALAALATALLIGHWVRRECGRALPGIVAMGLLFAAHGWLRGWYDLARNDTLFVLLVVATAYLLRWHGRAGAWLAGVTIALAFLAKQSTLMWLPALVTGALLRDWRRGLQFAAAAGIAVGGTVLAYHFATDGWFTFFVFEMPREHPIQPDRKLGFWTEDMVPVLPLAVLALGAAVGRLRAGRRGDALFLAAFAGGGLLASYLSRLHAGGYDNVLLYVFVGGCVLAPVAVAEARRPALRMLGLLLLAAQFFLLVVDPASMRLRYDPRHMVPSAAHRHASEQLVSFLHAQKGPVLVLAHGGLAARAGKAPSCHAQAVFDLFFALTAARQTERSKAAFASFYGPFLAALQQGRYAAIVLDAPPDPKAPQIGARFEEVFRAGLEGYRRRPGDLVSEPAALQPVTGMIIHTPYALIRK